MTYSETLDVMSVLQAAYPASFRNMSRKQAEDIAKLWTDIFADVDVAAVLIAVKAVISTRTSDFVPSPGYVRTQLMQLANSQQMTAQEAWSLVSRLVGHRPAGVSYEAAFASLPETVQHVVRTPNQLREWGLLPEQTFDSVIYSQFVRAYNTQVERDSFAAALPADVKLMLAGTADRLSIGGGGASE